ncbi:MAG: hypothetical protein JNK74_04830 [Candidatus Hydrogenedentes bacterium]|nr:hypothetical protein [Candidatus Hydrogenedentota bacterium]
MALDARHVILVEGMDDLHTIAGFFNRLKLTEFRAKEKQTLSLRWRDSEVNLDIVSSGGIDEAKDFAKTLADIEMLDDCKALALVVDADENPIDRWRSVAATLRLNGHEPPPIPSPTGTILNSASAVIPRIGVWIMPDNQQAGMLETFLGMCVPQRGENPIWQRALAQTDFVKTEISESSRFKDVHLDKARIHSYLAWNDPPGVPLGQAVLKKILDPSSEQAAVFLQWIRDVFEFRSPSGDES